MSKYYIAWTRSNFCGQSGELLHEGGVTEIFLLDCRNINREAESPKKLRSPRCPVGANFRQSEPWKIKQRENYILPST